MNGKGYSLELFWVHVLPSNVEEMFGSQTTGTGKPTKHATGFRLREADTNADVWLELGERGVVLHIYRTTMIDPQQSL